MDSSVLCVCLSDSFVQFSNLYHLVLHPLSLKLLLRVFVPLGYSFSMVWLGLIL